MFDGLDENTKFGKTLQETEFTFKPSVVPLNHASYGAVARRLQETQRRLLDEMNSQPDVWFRENVYTYWNESVQAAARAFHCDPQDLVFVTNATEGINTVLKAYDFREGETLLSTSLTYGAVTLTIRDVAARLRVIKADVLDVKFPIASEEEVVNLYEEYLKTHPKTKIIIIDHISSPSGVLMPTKKITKKCHEYGVFVLVDGAHAPGHIQLDLEDLDVDFYSGNFHKWLFNPRGCALLYVKRKHSDWVKPLVTSWWTDKSFGDQFFQGGSRDHVPFICAKYALDFIERLGGMDRVMAYSSSLASEAQDYLVKLFNTEKLQMPKSMEAPNFKLVLLPEIKGIHDKASTDIKNTKMVEFFMDFYKRTNIQTLTAEIEGRYYLRVSASIYNYMDEYKRLGDEMLKYIREINES